MSSTGFRALDRICNVSRLGAIEPIPGRRVIVAGSTLEEAASEISRVCGPSVGRIGLELLESTGSPISFRGAAIHSGNMKFFQNLTLKEVLDIAEPTEAADLTSVIVIGSTGAADRVDVEANPDYRLKPGDQILVPQLSKSGDVLILGAVKNPGSYKFVPSESVAQAIARAGGLTGHAVQSQIAVIRDEKTVDLKDAPLKRGDTIRIPSIENGKYVSLIGFVKSPGLIPYREGMTLLEAIEAAGGTIVGAGLDSVQVRKVFNGAGRPRKFDISILKKGSPNDPKLAASDVIVVPAFEFKAPVIKSGFKPVVPPRPRA